MSFTAPLCGGSTQLQKIAVGFITHGTVYLQQIILPFTQPNYFYTLRHPQKYRYKMHPSRCGFQRKSGTLQ